MAKIDVPDEVVDLVAENEGYSASPYLDTIAVPHVWTYGYGSITDLDGKPVTANTPPVTIEQARELVRRELQGAANELASDVKVPMSEDQIAALEDFIYNLGQGAFASSTLLADIRQQNWDKAEVDILDWDHAGGKVILGLLNRRKREAALLANDAPSAGDTEVAQASVPLPPASHPSASPPPQKAPATPPLAPSAADVAVADTADPVSATLAAQATKETSIGSKTA